MHKIRDFDEGHSTVGEWQGNGIVCVNRPLRVRSSGVWRSADWSPTFRYDLSVPSRVRQSKKNLRWLDRPVSLDCLTDEEGTDRFYRNVGT
jgi:hypothetical protein